MLVWTHIKGLNVDTFLLKVQVLAKAKSSMTEVMQQATLVGESQNGDGKGNHCILYRIPSPQTKQCCKSSNLKSKHPPALLCPRINFHLLPSFLFLELFHAWRKPSVCVLQYTLYIISFKDFGKKQLLEKYLPTIQDPSWNISNGISAINTLAGPGQD